MRLCLLRFALLICSIAILPQIDAQSIDQRVVRTKLLALEHIRDQAEASGDQKALDDLFDKKLIYIDADGAILNKPAFLSREKSQHPQQVISEVTAVQVFDETAIVNGTRHWKEFKNGRLQVRQFSFTDTWIQQGSTWVCITAQITPIMRLVSN